MSKKILIIEDNTNFLTLVEEFLSKYDFTLVSSSNGKEGLEKFFTPPFPNLVILDLKLPEIDGFEVCNIIRRSPQGEQVPIIVMTAIYKSKSYEQRVRGELKANAFLKKPFELTKLKEKIDSFLGASSYSEQSIKAQNVQKTATLVNIEGDLSASNRFARLIFSIFQLKMTGILYLKQSEKKKNIYFSKGVPVYVQSNSVDETLASLLLKKGKINDEHYLKSMNIMREKKITQNDALIKMGLLNSVELYNELKERVLVTIADCYRWSSGSYFFINNPTFVHKVPIFDYHPYKILHFCAINYINPIDVENMLQTRPDMFIVPASGNLRDWECIDLLPQESNLLEQIKSGINLTMVLKSIQEKPRVAQFIGILLELNMIKLDSKPVPVRKKRPRTRPKQVCVQDVIRTAQASLKDEEKSTPPAAPKPEPPQDAATTEKVKARENEIMKAYLSLMSKDYFSLFGLQPESASPGAIKKSYFHLAKKYHPDHLGREIDENIVVKAKELFQRINKAYKTLSDERNVLSIKTKSVSLVRINRK